LVLVVEDVAEVDGGAVDVGEPDPDGDPWRGRVIGEGVVSRSLRRLTRIVPI
jgi:hypothetical protein